jgi:hypothetical protein
MREVLLGLKIYKFGLRSSIFRHKITKQKCYKIYSTVKFVNKTEPTKPKVEVLTRSIVKETSR